MQQNFFTEPWLGFSAPSFQKQPKQLRMACKDSPKSAAKYFFSAVFTTRKPKNHHRDILSNTKYLCRISLFVKENEETK
jgi:hypothetical protein